jgi:serine/threonine-protein kinase
VSVPIRIGDLVAGKYRVDRVLGEGGMGVVVAATHEHLEQRVALKFLLPDLTTNAEVVQRFMREARAAVKIQSEHVARVLDVGATESGTPFMVMEFLDGEDLAQVLAARGPLTMEEAVGYVLEASEAVAEAHSYGIVHRDLKPPNLFLARRANGRPIVKVLDFGISKVPTSGKDAAATSATALMGSPVYMSPEQMVAPATVDVRTDVWCLGVVLYELLSQKIPFEGETMPELVFKVVQKPHLPLRSFRPDLPSELLAVVDRCLEKEQAGRFATVAELARALAPFAPARSAQSVERIEHVLGSTNRAAAPAPPRPALVPHAGAHTLTPTTSQPSIPRRGRLVVRVALGLVAAIAAAAVVAFLALRPARAPSVPAPATTAPPPATATASAPPAASPAAVVLSPPPADSPAPSAPGASAASTLPWWAGKAPPPRPSARPGAAAPASSAACRIVSYFDTDGNKHFKQECP